MPRKRKNQKITKKTKRGRNPNRKQGRPDDSTEAPQEKNSVELNNTRRASPQKTNRPSNRQLSQQSTRTSTRNSPQSQNSRNNSNRKRGGSRNQNRARSENLTNPSNDPTNPSSNHPSNQQNNLQNRVLEGRVDIHPDGFGFLIASDPTLPNIYVTEDSLKYVMHRDIVQVRVEGDAYAGQKYRGKVVDVVRRAQKEFIGLYRPHSGGALVIPIEARDRKHAFKVHSSKVNEAIKSGMAVLCRVITHPEPKGGTVEIERLMEDPNSASSDTLRVLIGAGWPREFSKPALSEAENRAERWQERMPASSTRDIRNVPLVTIDGRDAKDFDDAVFAQKEGNNIRLMVAIADVSLFVQPGTALDKEAFERATSVYFPDHVVPMLPEVLSNGVCSLNPNVDRPCLVCEATITPQGQIKDFEFYEGIMKSHHRLTYELMQGFIEKEDYALKELKKVAGPLEMLIEVFHRLRKARSARGSIDLDLPEAVVQLEPTGEVRDIVQRSRLDAHRLIEECMLAANECAAKFLHTKLQQGVYRIHERPDEKKIKDLMDFLKLSGIEISHKKSEKKEILSHLESPSDFNHLITSLKSIYPDGDPIFRAVQTLILRTLKQAKYSTQRVGHFALASEDYTHFTSPIRRYPDLMVHRLIKEALKIELNPGNVDLERQAIYSSEQERSAMECERKLIDIKKCRYLEKHLGEEFEATVNGITEKGLFCTIEGHFVEGLVNAETIYSRVKHHHDPQTLSYAGPGSSRIRLGTRLKILVAAVSIETRRIDFDLIEILK